jgi:hypothetical protein
MLLSLLWIDKLILNKEALKLMYDIRVNFANL